MLQDIEIESLFTAFLLIVLAKHWMIRFHKSVDPSAAICIDNSNNYQINAEGKINKIG